MINRQRLSFARRRRKLTKKVLAQRLGVTPRTVTAYESGEKSPSPGTLKRIVEELQFPEEFFFGGDLQEVPKENVSFRSLSKMTAAERDSALSSASLALALNDWISERFRLPKPGVPDLKQVGDPATAAEILRGKWDLGTRPIPNMIHLLESNGVRVFSLAEKSKAVDAFSMWQKSTPFIFLNTMKSAERSRFDAAHELGHLVLHQHQPSVGREAEIEANQFASAFLMPEADVKAHASWRPSLGRIISEKRRWRVSAFAFARRLKDLGMLTDWGYHEVCRRMGAKGYRTDEPNTQARETSQVLRKILSQLADEGISKRSLAAELHITTSELNKLIFGLTITDIDGGRATTPGRAELRLVK